MIRFLLSFSLFLILQPSFGQIKTLSAPTPEEKKGALHIVGAYNALTNVMRTDNEALRKKISQEFLKKYMVHTNTLVYNDIDTSAAPDDNIRFFSYTMQLKDAWHPKAKVNTDKENIKLSPVKYDQLRNYHFLEITTTKTIEWKELKDTLQEVWDAPEFFTADGGDSADFAPQRILMPARENVTHTITVPLVFYIRFVKTEHASSEFKLLAITHPDGEPSLDPLHRLQTWWLEMDPEWKSYIRKTQGLPEFPAIHEIQKVTGTYELDLSDAQFKNFSGLSHFNNVKKLTLTGSSIATLEDIKGMSSLKVLDMSKTKINDLSGIESLTNLEELICKGQKLTSLAPLKRLTNLIELDASENELEDIEALRGLKNLLKLNISLNYSLKDIEPVSGLTNLEKLDMRKLEIKTLEPIRNLTNLVYLDCFNSGIETLEPIRNHRKLMYLDCGHNKITSLEPIKNHVFITDLIISGTSITDLSDIKNFEYLRSFIANNSPLASLGPLHKFDTLQEIKVYYTKIDKNEIQKFKKNHPKCRITYY
ncbi:leucine-rich repeat domain-containing protein [Cytophagaceae bacterium ABcell3]|nr:leucine-rich repeat domain-containing protein [Cytophagaceae bacterium ABcell3]